MRRDGDSPGFAVASRGADGLRLAVLELERGLIHKVIDIWGSYGFAVFAGVNDRAFFF